jgi:hypothetical protein
MVSFGCFQRNNSLNEESEEILILFLLWLSFFYLVCEAIGTAVTPGLLCQPPVILKKIMEEQMECNWQRKPKLSGKTCPSATFVHHKIPYDQTRV